MYKALFSILFFLSCISYSGGQELINNPSFEDKVGIAAKVNYWNKCNKNTSPDILPGVLDVELKASDGETFLGLITRDNGDRESLSQKMKQKLEKGACYEFELDLARATEYLEHNIPVGLKVWLGTGSCTQEQMILHVKIVEDTDWKTFKARFIAKGDYQYIRISPVPASGIYFNYNGNVLIDNISDFTNCNRS